MEAFSKTTESSAKRKLRIYARSTGRIVKNHMPLFCKVRCNYDLHYKPKTQKNNSEENKYLGVKIVFRKYINANWIWNTEQDTRVLRNNK